MITCCSISSLFLYIYQVYQINYTSLTVAALIRLKKKIVSELALMHPISTLPITILRNVLMSLCYSRQMHWHSWLWSENLKYIANQYTGSIRYPASPLGYFINAFIFKNIALKYKTIGTMYANGFYNFQLIKWMIKLTTHDFQDVPMQNNESKYSILF